MTPRCSSQGSCDRVVEIVDHLVAAREHGGRRRGPGPQARNPADLGEQLARTQQRLRRHARVVGALAADEVLLDERDLETGLAEPPGGDLAGRPGADDDDVEAALGHRPSLTHHAYATIRA